MRMFTVVETAWSIKNNALGPFFTQTFDINALKSFTSFSDAKDYMFSLGEQEHIEYNILESEVEDE